MIKVKVSWHVGMLTGARDRLPGACVFHRRGDRPVVLQSVVIGVAMAWLFRKEERERKAAVLRIPVEEPTRPP